MSEPTADNAASSPVTLTDVPCPACGCLCDDLRITVADHRITHIDPPCAAATNWFTTAATVDAPVAQIAGQPATADEALARAVEILAGAANPLIFGLASCTTDGARAAVALAERLGATIDTATSRFQAAAIRAFPEVGQSTCTLGEVRHRADLVIYWGTNPAVTHPRHMERYTLWPRGEFIAGREERTLVVIDTRPTETSQQANLFLQVQPGSDFELLWALRASVRGVPLSGPSGEETGNNEVAGVPLRAIEDLAQRMKRCRYGIICFGPELTAHNLGHRTVEALYRLVAELNDHTRFYVQPMRAPGDLGAAVNVLCWQAGYPMAVSFSRGYPRYSPGEYQADQLLARGEVDACLLVGSECTASLSAAAQAALAKIAVIVLDHPHVVSVPEPAVRFTTAVPGIHQAGTAYRMDEVPIPLKAILTTHYPTDAEVLTALAKRLVSGTA